MQMDDYLAQGPLLKSTKWESIADFNPDHNPSFSEIYTKPDGKDTMLAARVRGLGVIVMRTRSLPDDPTGKLRVTGLSIVTKEELGYSPGV